MLITRAPWSVAQVIPEATLAVVPDPSAPRTFTGMSEQRQQYDATPIELLLAAAATPAAQVPWPLSSTGSAAPFRTLYPATSFPWRSGWARSTPVSSEAITTLAEPCVRSHAAVVRVLTCDH